MNYSEFVKKFLLMEEENNLFSYRVKDRVMWNYIRYPIFYEIFLRMDQLDEVCFKKRKRYFKFFMELVLLPKRILQILSAIMLGKEYDIIVSTYDRKDMLDGKKVNISFYPIIKVLRANYQVLLFDPSRLGGGFEKDYSCDVLSSRPFYWLSRLQKFIGYSPREREILVTIGKIINKTFDLSCDIIPLASDCFLRQYLEYKIYKKIFRKFKPKIVLFSDDGINKGWIEAARELGITVIDCQHSLLSSINILYRYPENIVDYNLQALPDIIFTFGEFWHDKYHSPSKLVPIGFPFHEEKKANIQGKPIAKGRNIVVISSMHSGKKLERLVLELSRMLPDYQIIYKLRVEEYKRWREIYSAELIIRSNITMVDNNSTSLYEYFAMSTHQIGINSTALIEGLAFDLTTFIFKDGWYGEMQSLIDDGYVFLVQTAEEISQRIRHNVHPAKRFRGDEIFKGQATRNISNEIHSLLNP